MNYAFSNRFCNIVEKLQNISTDGSVRKFAHNSPLRKFLESEAILSKKQFTITEILLPIPNTKDEVRYARWYPFKSKIVVYIDFDETKFNLQMMIEKCAIRIVRRNDQSPLGEYDQQLLSAIKERFKKFKFSV